LTDFGVGAGGFGEYELNVSACDERLFEISSVPTLIEQIHLVMRVGRIQVSDGARK
jgi:hypothetical protein